MNTIADDFRILSPTAILGYGFPAESFRRGVERRPHLIACDAGSTDPGRITSAAASRSPIARW